MSELWQIAPVPSGSVTPRLNLLVGSVDPRLAYAGIHTALQVFDAIALAANNPPDVRIVTRFGLPRDLSLVPGYVPSDAADERSGRRLVSVGEGPKAQLPVGPGDVFVATFWTTADLAIRVRRWQRAQYGRTPDTLAYLIQDFEPSFYPWSAQYLLARATYESDDKVVAVFNTDLLRQYFHAEGLQFAHEFSFEPRMPQALRANFGTPPQRQRLLLVYGRPNTPRNAFPLVVEALRQWHSSDPRAQRWRCLSAGEDHGDVDLGGAALHSLGKLDMPTYARLLKTAGVGFSLMVSPHPSYPPLEMAHSGMLVVTNRFQGKDLATWHDNIVSEEDVTPEGLARAISRACARFEADPLAGERAITRRPDYLGQGDQFGFSKAVADLLIPTRRDRMPE